VYSPWAPNYVYPSLLLLNQYFIDDKGDNAIGEGEERRRRDEKEKRREGEG